MRTVVLNFTKFAESTTTLPETTSTMPDTTITVLADTTPNDLIDTTNGFDEEETTTVFISPDDLGMQKL